MLARHKRKMEEPMKEFYCGTLVPGCEWHTRNEEEAEIMRAVRSHTSNPASTSA